MNTQHGGAALKARIVFAVAVLALVWIGLSVSNCRAAPALLSLARDPEGSLRLTVSEPIGGTVRDVAINYAGPSLVEFPCATSSWYLSGQGTILSGWVYSAVPANTWLIARLTVNGIGAGCASLWTGPGDEPAIAPCGAVEPPPPPPPPPDTTATWHWSFEATQHSGPPNAVRRELSEVGDFDLVGWVPRLQAISEFTEALEHLPGEAAIATRDSVWACTPAGAAGILIQTYDGWKMMAPLVREPGKYRIIQSSVQPLPAWWDTWSAWADSVRGTGQ